MSGILTVSYFLFSLFFSLVTLLLWARIALRYFRVSTLHPISQSIHRFSDPLIAPIASIIPSSNIRRARYDWVGLTILILVEIIRFTLIGLLFLSAPLPWMLVLLFVLADLIVQPCNLLFYAILIRVIMSWVNPQWHNPLADLLRIMTDPLLRIGRRVLPVVAGFDFSPFFAIILLKVITLFISASLPLNLI